MSEIRHDPIYGHRVIIAPDRLLRPNAISCEPWEADDATDCPFCRGHETQTPPASLQLPDGSHSWQVRVVPNRYPAVSAAAGNGRQEVVIESPDHVAGLLALTESQRQLVFRAYRARFRAYAQDAALHYAVLFKNHGRLAGASLFHVHSQLVALTEPMDVMRVACATAKAHFDSHKRCIFCELVEREVSQGVRLVDQTESFVAFCPAASRMAYETWILPKRHASRFELTADDQLEELCWLTSLSLARLEHTVKHAAYNYVIHSAPFDTVFDEHYHWHMVVIPRIAGIAGFELSTGVFINAVAPEIGAEQLRTANITNTLS